MGNGYIHKDGLRSQILRSGIEFVSFGSTDKHTSSLAGYIFF